MTCLPTDPVLDERFASEALSDLLASYLCEATPHHIRELFQHRWPTLSRLGHALHNAQVRRARANTMASEYEDETMSG